MKVILLQDVRGVGRKHDIKDVSDGYGNNFLLPKKLAKVATPQATASLEVLKKDEALKNKVHLDLVSKNLKSVEAQKIVIKEKANEKGHLFAAIKAEEIVKAIKSATHVDIDPSWVVLEKHIKTTGEFTLTIAPHELPIKSTVFLSVEAL